jgi:Ser-tRNA(Ala) deacylase AlaX
MIECSIVFLEIIGDGCRNRLSLKVGEAYGYKGALYLSSVINSYSFCLSKTFTYKKLSISILVPENSNPSNMSPRTKLLYQTSGELRHHLTKILSLTPVSSLPAADQSLLKEVTPEDHALITDETIFYVQGGGQPTDTGVISSSSAKFNVTSVRHPAEGAAILHFGHFNPDSGNDGFKEGDEVNQEIDGEKRDLHSRLHTAGHILGLAINHLSREDKLPKLIESKASHYPSAASVEFVGNIPSSALGEIQEKVDEFVASKRKVEIHFWPMEKLRKECEGVDEGFKLPEGDELGRVVEIVGLGSYPCGGTHVGDCGGCGRIEVRKISRSKGVSRISYRCD